MLVEIKMTEADMEAIADKVAARLAGVQKPAHNDLVTREDYAAQMKMNPATVSRHFASGELKGKYLGRRLYIYKNQEDGEPVSSRQ